jgi:hypothetical protein
MALIVNSIFSLLYFMGLFRFCSISIVGSFESVLTTPTSYHYHVLVVGSSESLRPLHLSGITPHFEVLVALRRAETKELDI